MFNRSPQKPLIVKLMDISKQNEAILKFFISGIGKKVFNIASSPAEIEAYIIDYDFPGAQAHWDNEYADSKVPRIILSTSDPKVDASVWVAKPLSSKNLIAAAKSIRDLLINSPLSSISSPSIEDSVEEKMPKIPAMISPNLDKRTKISSPKKDTFNKKLLTPLVTTTDKESSNNTSKNNSIDHTDEKQENIVSKKIEAAHEKERSPKTKEEIALEVELREKRWKELCGKSDDIAGSNVPRYIPENHFIGKLIGGVRLAKQSQQIVEVKSKPYSVFILPNEHQIFTELSTEETEFIEFSRAKVNIDEMSLHILSSIETGKLELKMSKQPKCTHSLESFLWTSSLLASQGRLPITVDLERKTALKYWPSFARIEAFPYSMRIAALWHHSPDTLFQMAEKLGIPQRYVFAFYSGADALDLIERDPKRVKQQMKAKPKKKGGGLISRLFKRLLKGGGTS